MGKEKEGSLKQLFNYPGNKIKYCQQINRLVRNSGVSKLFVEPFCGTASVMLNLDMDFEKYVINDHSREVVTIINAFKQCNYSDLEDMYEEVEAKYGSIKADKEAYYNFRNEYNSKWFNTGTIEEGLFLYIASRAAINSLFRIGPSGFNQSYGRRGDRLTMTQQDFEEIKKKLKISTVLNTDYKEVISEFDSKDTLFFVDPPYYERKIKGSYKDEEIFNQDDYLEILLVSEAKIIYTDVLSEYIQDKLGWNYEIINSRKNVSPGNNKGEGTDFTEVIYYNF